MLLNIATLDKIEEEAAEIQGYLEIDVSEQIEEVQQRGNDLSVYMARSGKLLADAKVHRDRALKESILRRIDTNLSPSTLNKLVEAQCEQENYLVNWLDRINRTCTHQIDWARTMISKAKAEMQYQGFNT